MAHFAQLDTSGKVLQVITVANAEILDSSGSESEEKGISFCKDLFGEDTDWVQTSYTGSFRKQFASVGFTYNKDNDLFIRPCPLKGLRLNPETFDWEYPSEPPLDGYLYSWDQDQEDWARVEKPFPSWVADYTLGQYVAPVERPLAPGAYYWNEETLSWERVDDLPPE
jgi:hypothetical protein